MSGPRFPLDTNGVIGVLKGSEPVRDILEQTGASPGSRRISGGQLGRLSDATWVMPWGRMSGSRY
jgi:hypothetical protein